MHPHANSLAFKVQRCFCWALKYLGGSIRISIRKSLLGIFLWPDMGCEASSWSPCHRYVHDCSWLIFLLIYEDSWWFMNIYDKACFLMIRLSYSNPDLLRFTILDLGIRLLNILTCGIWYKDPRTADDLGEFRVTHGQSSSTPSTSSCKISTSAVGIIVPFQRKRVGYQNQT